MSKKIIIKIKSDGTIEGNTEGISGKKCMDYLELFSQLTDAHIIDSGFTQEYYEQDQTAHNITDNHVIQNNQE